MDHLDQQALLMLKEVMEDDFALLMNTFMQDSENRVKVLESLIDTDNADAIRRSAHSFKGSCSNIGASQLAAYCSELEAKGNNNDIGDIQGDVDRIKQEFQVVKELLLTHWV